MIQRQRDRYRGFLCQRFDDRSGYRGRKMLQMPLIQIQDDGRTVFLCHPNRRAGAFQVHAVDGQQRVLLTPGFRHHAFHIGKHTASGYSRVKVISSSFNF